MLRKSFHDQNKLMLVTYVEGSTHSVYMCVYVVFFGFSQSFGTTPPLWLFLCPFGKSWKTNVARTLTSHVNSYS